MCSILTLLGRTKLIFNVSLSCSCHRPVTSSRLLSSTDRTIVLLPITRVLKLKRSSMHTYRTRYMTSCRDNDSSLAPASRSLGRFPSPWRRARPTPARAVCVPPRPVFDVCRDRRRYAKVRVRACSLSGVGGECQVSSGSGLSHGRWTEWWQGRMHLDEEGIADAH